MSEKCPKCGDSMALRSARNGYSFWGCKSYPRCNGTRPYKEYRSPTTPKVVTAPVSSRKEWTPSDYQKAIFDFVEHATGNAIVQAVAGSGKTSTGIKALELTPKSSDVAFVAFNRSIAKELQARAPEHVSASTYHSLGLASIKVKYPRIKVDDRKDDDLFKDMVDNSGFQTALKNNRAAILRLSSLLKGSLMPSTRESVNWLADRYGIALGDETEEYTVVSSALQLFEKSINDESSVNFDDMIYWCATRVMPRQFDFVFSDESQDLNPAQTEMLKRMIRDGGRTVIVGDEKQCQPTGTMVAVGKQDNRWHLSDLTWKKIEDVKPGDSVLTFDRHAQYFVKTGTVTESEGHHYSGNLIRVTTEEFSSLCTPEHKWMVRWNKGDEKKWCTYLMQKGDSFRVGVTKLFHKSKGDSLIFGLSSRARQERAERAWILKIHDNMAGALVHEQYISLKYQIPEMIFHSDGKSTIHFTQEVIDAVYEKLGDLTGNAIKILSDHGRDIRFPIYTNKKNGNQQRQGRTTIFITQACNLISEYMQVIVIPKDGVITRKYSGKWQTINVSKEWYEGDVYSLNVDKYHCYISDGIVTQNSLYGFRGADVDAMEKLQNALSAIPLPLSITYRCPKSHVALAKELVPQIEHSEFAIEGLVDSISHSKMIKMLDDGDLVMCRVNAPLIRPAFELIRNGRKASIVGRDIGKNVVSLVVKMADKAGTHSAIGMLGELEDYVDKEIPKLEKTNRNTQAQMLEDQYETILAVSDGCDTVDDVVKKIESIFKDDIEGVRFSSIHRAKGTEAMRTFILRPDLMPHPMAKQPWEVAQEWNCKYVALTRSKSEMYFV